MSENNNSIVGGLSWSFAERILAQLVTTVVGLILARILGPEEYGIISIVMIFITICDVFVIAGFGTAVVRKKQVDKMDFDTAFYLSFVMSIVLYIILFFTAPYIAKFFEVQILSTVIRVLGIRIVFTSFNNIQQTHVQRQMAFKKFFFSTLLGTTISCAIGVIMAFKGYGVWAIVGQYLTNTIINTVVLAIIGGWNPGFNFSKKRAKEIYSFGFKVLGAQLISTAQTEIQGLLMGKYFGSSGLAYYEQGRKYPALFIVNVDAAVNKVMLPSFARVQDDLSELKRLLRKSVRLGIYVLAPIMIGFFVVAEPFVQIVLTEKWLMCVPFLQIFCLLYLLRPLNSSCHQALLALNKVGVVITIMIIINAISFGGLFVAIFALNNPVWVGYFLLIAEFVSLLCFMISTNLIIGYKFRQQLCDLLPAISIGVVMGLVVYAISYIQINSIVLLAIQVIVGALMYVTLSVITKLEAFVYIKCKIKSKLRK